MSEDLIPDYCDDLEEFVCFLFSLFQKKAVLLYGFTPHGKQKLGKIGWKIQAVVLVLKKMGSRSEFLYRIRRARTQPTTCA
jgi:hypothetical protein